MTNNPLETTHGAVTDAYPFVSSGGSTVYETLRYNDGFVSCNCPGWIFRKNCKHAREVHAGRAVATTLSLPRMNTITEAHSARRKLKIRGAT